MYTTSQINPLSLNALSKVAKILYDDVTFVILNYIISHDTQQLIEEQEMASNLNISYGTVRTCLTTLEKHGILLSSEHVKKKEEEDETMTQTNNPQSSTNTEGHSINYRQMHRSAVAYRKNKTSDWKLNNTFYNRLHNRFNELKRCLKNNLDQRATLWFECPRCQKKYTESEGSLNGLICTDCDTRPTLTEKGKEDVTQLRKKCNEIMDVLNEIFMANDKGGPEFIHLATARELKGNTKSWNINERKGPLMNNKFEINFENLEEPSISQAMHNIQKDQKKLNQFQDVMGYYLQDRTNKK